MSKPGKKFLIKREIFTQSVTLGSIYIDGDQKPFCYTLEENYDKRTSRVTGSDDAIDPGIYDWTIEKHLKHGVVFRISNVPGRIGILIHSGNYAKDTEGCVLVGMLRGTAQVYESKKALALLLEKIAPGMDKTQYIGKVEIR